MKLQRIFILAIILLALLPAYRTHCWLQTVLEPRCSFTRFLVYLVVTLGLVFLYTFLLVTIISTLFPPAKG